MTTPSTRRRRSTEDPIQTKQQGTSYLSMTTQVFIAATFVLIQSVSVVYAFQIPASRYNQRYTASGIAPTVGRRTTIERFLSDKSLSDGDDEVRDDDDDFYETVKLSKSDTQVDNMQDMLANLIDISSPPKRVENNDNDGSPPSIMEQPTTSELEQLVSQLESIIVDNEGPEALTELADNDSDAPFLDSNAYANYRTTVNQDGSLKPSAGTPMDFPSVAGNNKAYNTNDRTTRRNLRALVNPAPQSPDSYYTSTAKKGNSAEPTIEDLFAVKPRQANEVDEDLHRQIMAQEKGFQQQSKEFEGYLRDGDEASGAKAANMLREQRRRKDQEELALKLDREMSELGDILMNAPDPKEVKANPCTKCKCPLSQMELASGKGNGLCQLCYGDMIASTSDMRFLDAPPTDFSKSSPYRSSPYSGNNRQQSSYNNNNRQSRQQSSQPNRQQPSRQSRRVETPIPTRTVSAPPSSSLSPSMKQQQQNSSGQPDGQQQTRPPQKKSSPATKRKEDTEMSNLRRQVVALQQQVQKHRRQEEAAAEKAEEREREILRLRQLVLELEDKLSAIAPESSETKSDETGVQAPWMEVVDPDTGEIFYWNEETEEMRWEMED